MLYLIQLRSQSGTREDFWPVHSIVFEHQDENLDEGPDRDAYFTGKRTKPLNFGEILNKVLQDAGVSKDEFFVTVEKIEQHETAAGQSSAVLALNLGNVLAGVMRDQGVIDEPEDESENLEEPAAAKDLTYFERDVLDALRNCRRNGIPDRETRAVDVAFRLKMYPVGEVKGALQKLVDLGLASTYRLNGIPRYSALA